MEGVVLIIYIKLKSKYRFTNIYYQKLCHYIRPLEIDHLDGYLYIYRDLFLRSYNSIEIFLEIFIK